MSTTSLFLYGTLKRGMSHHHLVVGQEFVAEVRTQPVYRLHALEWHPALVEVAEGGIAVRGEVWRVDEPTLARLDAFEGTPSWFARRPIRLQALDEPVEAYFYVGDMAKCSDCGDSWPPAAS